MRCSKCSRVIEDDCNFCPYCGNKQLFTFNKLLIKAMAFYPVWLIVHTIILFFLSDGIFRKESASKQWQTFWPFNPGMDFGLYDSTEFILYSLIPLLFILLSLLLSKLD